MVSGTVRLKPEPTVASDVETSCCTMIDCGATMYVSAGIENIEIRKNMGMRRMFQCFISEKGASFDAP